MDRSEYLDCVPEATRRDAEKRLKRLQVDLTTLEFDAEKLVDDACLYHFCKSNELEDMMLEELGNLDSFADLLVPVTALHPRFERGRFVEMIQEGFSSRLRGVQRDFVLPRIKYLRFLSDPTEETLNTYRDAGREYSGYSGYAGHQGHTNNFIHKSTASSWPYHLILVEKGFPYKSISKQFVEGMTKWMLLGFNSQKLIFESQEKKDGLARKAGVNPGVLDDVVDWVPHSYLEYDDWPPAAGLPRLNTPSRVWEEDVFWEEWMPVYLDAWETMIEEYINYIGRRS